MNILRAVKDASRKGVTGAIALLLSPKEPKENLLTSRNRIIPSEHAVWCFSCRAVSDAFGDSCPSCQQSGTLISLSRLLMPSPESGRVDFICAD